MWKKDEPGQQRPEVLKKVPFFEDLTDAELSMIAAVMTEKAFARNELIFLEDDPGEGMFIIRQGRVKVSKSSADGREQILHILKEGDIFAEVVLFDQGVYPASAEAVEETRVWLLRNGDMEVLLQNHPKLAVKLLRLMGRRLRQAQLLIRDLALHDTCGRLAGLLLRFARREGERTERGIVLDLDLTRQELASMIGTSRETVARILSRFQREGLLELDKQKIVIRDEQKLRDWA
ncbi:MAG: CRP-like cAMP-activated global transcriptional regulator [Syntrophomonadaceae bacterium]|nr:CRP-like cAMP-activated global transcriptional regulator [Bacillota bacterium]